MNTITQQLEVTAEEFEKIQAALAGPLNEWKNAEDVAAIVGIPVEKLVYRKTKVIIVGEVKNRLSKLLP